MDFEETGPLDRVVGQKILKTHVTGDSVSILLPGDMVFVLWHQQDCCESFWLENEEEVRESLGQLEGMYIEEAEERVVDISDSCSESGTATFYNIRAMAGYCDIQFRGESNGYYSETARAYYGRLYYNDERWDYSRPDSLLKELQEVFSGKHDPKLTREDHLEMINRCQAYFYNSLMAYKDELIESAWENIGDILYSIGMDPHDEESKEYIKGIAIIASKNIEIK